MIIENSLNPNCSEAVMRIKADQLSKKKQNQLFKELEKAIKKYDYDTWVSEATIFGIGCFEIKGDMPYNDPKTLEAIIKKYEVEYEFGDE